MNDLFNIMDAGYGTLLTSMASCLFHLKRNPKVLKKLKTELERTGIRKEALNEKGFETERGISLIDK